jgi:hypothetical protein
VYGISKVLAPLEVNNGMEIEPTVSLGCVAWRSRATTETSPGISLWLAISNSTTILSEDDPSKIAFGADTTESTYTASMVVVSATDVGASVATPVVTSIGVDVTVNAVVEVDADVTKVEVNVVVVRLAVLGGIFVAKDGGGDHIPHVPQVIGQYVRMRSPRIQVLQ